MPAAVTPPAGRFRVVRFGLVPLAFVALLCSACASAGSTPQVSGNAVATSSPPKASQAVANGGFDVSGLHIQAPDGLNCPPGFAGIPGLTGRHLVLATDRLTYDAAELQQMGAFASEAARNRATDRSAAPPQTLRWVSSALAGVPPSRDAWGAQQDRLGIGCGGALEITNTGAAAIQITQIDLRLTAEAAPNTERYRLLDVCTLPDYTSGCSPTYVSRGGVCSVYALALVAHPAEAGTIFSVPVATQQCPSPVLNPRDTVDIDLSVFGAGDPANDTYAVVPEIKVQDAAGARIVQLAQLTTAVAFANLDQFTCYHLQGDTFAEGALNPPHGWCL